jgi:conjugal transfer/entry exclusion protein
VKAREMVQQHSELARELNALKKSVATLDADTRRQFDQVYEAILGLMSPGVRRQ